MNKRKVGILLILLAIIISGFYCFKQINPEINNKNVEITEVLSTTDVIDSTELTIVEPIETTTEDISKFMKGSYEEVEHKGIKIKYPDEQVMTLIDNDKEGLSNIIQSYVNGYGFQDALYAAYGDLLELNSSDHLVIMTFCLKFKNESRLRYFYAEYNQNTKMWTYRPA